MESDLKLVPQKPKPRWEKTEKPEGPRLEGAELVEAVIEIFDGRRAKPEEEPVTEPPT